MGYTILTSDKTINLSSDSSTIYTYYVGNKDKSNNITGNINKSTITAYVSAGTASCCSLTLGGADGTNTAKSLIITVSKNTGETSRTFKIKLKNALNSISDRTLTIVQESSSSATSYEIVFGSAPYDDPLKYSIGDVYMMALDVTHYTYYIFFWVTDISGSGSSMDNVITSFGYTNNIFSNDMLISTSMLTVEEEAELSNTNVNAIYKRIPESDIESSYSLKTSDCTPLVMYKGHVGVSGNIQDIERVYFSPYINVNGSYIYVYWS